MSALYPYQLSEGSEGTLPIGSKSHQTVDVFFLSLSVSFLLLVFFLFRIPSLLPIVLFFLFIILLFLLPLLQYILAHYP